MAVTLTVFAAVQVLVPVFLRPHLIPPARSTVALASVQFNGTGETNGNRPVLDVSGVSGFPADWVTSSRPVNVRGQALTTVPAPCRSLSQEFISCLSRNGVRMAVSYQPASRYWILQWLETALYLIAAAALAAFSYRRIRRPLTA